MADQGSDSSVRDMGLLQSALAMPSQQFNGVFLHPDIPTMAAAYAFHICTNHPFVDGNKRAALAAMLAFATENGHELAAEPSEVESVILELAEGRMKKERLIGWAIANMPVQTRQP